MIIDLHTRIWNSLDQMGPSVAEAYRRHRTAPWDNAVAAPDTHEQAMEPVAAAVVLGFESGLLGASISAEQVAKSVATHPQKLVGFVGIDPMLGQAVEKLEAAIELGIVGVTVSPAAAGFHPADTRAMALYEACEDKGIPVLIESGATLSAETKLEFAQPFLLDEVARSFPKLKLVIGSVGLPWIDQGIAMLRKHPSVYADVAGLMVRSWQLYNALVNAYQSDVMGQILFGSNYPFCNPETAIVTLYSVNTISQGTPLPSVPREQIRTVVERDTFSELGIVKPKAAKRIKAEVEESTTSEFERVEVDDSEDPET